MRKIIKRFIPIVAVFLLLIIGIQVANAEDKKVILNYNNIGKAIIDDNETYQSLLSVNIKKGNEVTPTTLPYGSVNICDIEAMCEIGETYEIEFKDVGKAEYIDSQITINGEDSTLDEMQNGIGKITYTVENGTNINITINSNAYIAEYVPAKIVYQSENNMVSDNSYAEFDLIEENDMQFNPIDTITVNLNKETKIDNGLLRKNKTYYLVNKKNVGTQLTTYNVKDNNQTISEGEFTEENKIIRFETKDDSNIIINLQGNSFKSNLKISFKDTNGFDIPSYYFENEYQQQLQQYKMYIYKLDDNDEIVGEKITLEGNIDEITELKNELIPGKYIISTPGNEYLDVDFLEYKGNKKSINNYTTYNYDDETLINNGIIIEIKNGEDTDVTLYGTNYASLTYVLKYVDMDPNGLTHATNTHYFRFNRGEFYKLISEEEGKRTYIIAESCTEEELDNETCIGNNEFKLDTNGYTTIYYPLGESQFFEYNGFEGNFRPGEVIGNTESDSSYNTISTNRRIFYANYQNSYALKKIEKKDQEGNKTDASFYISTDIYNRENNTSKTMKYVYNHYEEREINGTLYKNVYEVKDVIELDEINEESIINTEDGEFILYYPVNYNYYEEQENETRYAYTYTGEETESLNIIEIEAKEGYIITDEITTAKAKPNNSYTVANYNQTTNNYRHKLLTVNEEEFNLDNYIEENWYNDGYEDRFKETNTWEDILKNDSNIYSENPEENYEYSQEYTIINKKLPTIKKIIENGNTDKKFTFDVIDSETNEIVETLMLNAKKEAYINVELLEDGKTYIIRERKDKAYINTKIEAYNGESKEDNNGKYYEFTYNKNLDKIYEANFYNKLKEEDVPKTIDNISKYILTAGISSILLTILVIKKKKESTSLK